MISTHKTSSSIPPVYKYLKREYAKNLMSKGEFFIGTLSFYRNLEEHDIRSDKNEGKKQAITAFPEETIIENSKDWDDKLGFLEGSNINYISGRVKIEKGTMFLGNEDLNDSYIYCASKIYKDYLKAKFQAEYCIEIFNVQGFLDAIDNRLSRLGLTYPNSGSGRNMEYVGHMISSEIPISGEWLKDEKYKDEEEFRFSFIPIIKKDGGIMEPAISYKNGINLTQFFKAADLILNLKPQLIKCKEAIKYCRWK